MLVAKDNSTDQGVIPGTTGAGASFEAVELLRDGRVVLAGLPGLHDQTDDLAFARVHHQATAQPRESVGRDTKPDRPGRLCEF